MASELWKIPQNWIWSTLGIIAKWSSGGTPTSTEPKYYDGNIPWLVIGDLTDGLVNTSSKKISLLGLENSSAKMVKKGSVLIAMYGSIGKLGIANIECATNQAIAFTEEIYNLPNKYLFYYLLSIRTQLNDVGKGGTQQNISQTVLKSFPLCLPPLNEQRRIVAKLEVLLGKVDGCQKRLEKIPRILKRFRQSVLAAACDGRLTADWRERNKDVEPGAELLKQIHDERRRCWEERELAKLKSKGCEPLTDDWKERYKEVASINTTNLPELPNQWKWTRIEEVGDVQLGRQRSPKYHNGPNMRPYLRVANVFENKIDVSSIMFMDFSEEEYIRYALRSGDILLNEGQSQELIGRPAIYKGEVPGACFTNTLIRFRVFLPLIPEYALAIFLNYLHSGVFQKIGSITTNIAHLSAGKFAKLHFPLAPLAEQQEIVRRVESLFKLADQLEARYQKAKSYVDKLTQSILAKAFRGELVAQDPNDEPASVLLERIKQEKEAVTTGKTRKASVKSKVANKKEIKEAKEAKEITINKLPIEEKFNESIGEKINSSLDKMEASVEKLGEQMTLPFMGEEQ